MIADLIADTLVVLHLAFILFVLLGAIPALKWPKIVWFHIPCVIWGTLIEFYGWLCPLTSLEHYFREAAGRSGYSDGFIRHYLLPIIYPPALTREIQLELGLGLMVLNIIIYSLVISISIRRAKRNQ